MAIMEIVSMNHNFFVKAKRIYDEKPGSHFSSHDIMEKYP
jgi:hypothetical protein